MVVIKQNTNLQALGTRLLSSSLAGGQTDPALAALQALNPHVDLNKVTAGTVLLVPDTPNFDASASDPVSGDVIDDFRAMVSEGLAAAATRLKVANEARSVQRADVTAVLKLAAVKKAIEANADLKAEVEEGLKASKDDAQQATEAEKILESATKGALAELTSLANLLG
jgi:hypothetical protein